MYLPVSILASSKRNIFKTILLIALLFITANVSDAAKKAESLALCVQHEYKIMYNNSCHGLIKCEQRKTLANHSYSVHGVGEVNLLFTKINSENFIHSVFENNHLSESKALVKRNNKTVRDTKTTYLPDRYLISKINQQQVDLQEDIDFSIACLYFKEPKGVKRVYSEVWGQFFQVIYRGNAHYTFKIPDGTEATYSYQNGVLEQVVTTSMIGEVKFVKNKTIILL